MTTLADIRELEHGASYPGFVLRESTTALVLFAAQWLGKQDAYWIAEAGLVGTCLDLQPDKLRQMEAIYPDGWEFVCANVFSFTETTDRVWDVVSIDCPTADFQTCADLLPRWCSLARDAVILGSGWDTKVVAPHGWFVSDVRKRSDYCGGVYWTCLEPLANQQRSPEWFKQRQEMGLPIAWHCACGKMNDPDGLFCPHCGAEKPA